MYSFRTHLLNIHYIPDTVLGVRDVNEDHSLISSSGKDSAQQMNLYINAKCRVRGREGVYTGRGWDHSDQERALQREYRNKHEPSEGWNNAALSGPNATTHKTKSKYKAPGWRCEFADEPARVASMQQERRKDDGARDNGGSGHNQAGQSTAFFMLL